MADAVNWLARFSKLRVDRAKGHPAPHKPLLLLSILSGMDDGESLPPVVPLRPELAFRFLTLGTVVAHRQTQRLDIRLPFHHLQSDGVWTSLDREGKESCEFRRTASARVNSSFAEFVADVPNRTRAKRVLITNYFSPPEQAALRELLNVLPESTGVSDGAAQHTEEATKQGREARFRLRVVAAYNYTCALTGYRLNAITGATVVDAAHIHRFADSRNNDPRNGLALSKNAHWLFDQGLWSLTDDFRILVARDHFDESGPNQFLLAARSGQHLLPPSDASVAPNAEYVRWHRENVFEG